MATLEKTIENRVRNGVKALGGKCIKLAGLVGIQDRLVIAPGGQVVFVEFKRSKSAKVGPLQDRWHKDVDDLGVPRRRVVSREGADALLAELKRGHYAKA